MTDAPWALANASDTTFDTLSYFDPPCITSLSLSFDVDELRRNKTFLRSFARSATRLTELNIFVRPEDDIMWPRRDICRGQTGGLDADEEEEEADPASEALELLSGFVRLLGELRVFALSWAAGAPYLRGGETEEDLEEEYDAKWFEARRGGLDATVEADFFKNLPATLEQLKIPFDPLTSTGWVLDREKGVFSRA